MTPDHELLELLTELDAIAAAIDHVEATHGPHPAIASARDRQRRLQRRVIAVLADDLRCNGGVAPVRH